MDSLSCKFYLKTTTIDDKITYSLSARSCIGEYGQE